MIKDEELRLIEETVDLLDHSKDLERHEEALLLKLQRWIDQPQLEGTMAVYLSPEEAKFLEAYLSSEVFQNFKETVCFDVSQYVILLNHKGNPLLRKSRLMKLFNEDLMN